MTRAVCGPAPVAEPFGPPVRLASAEAERGREVLMRHGLGAVPEFDERRLPNAGPDAIVAHLAELRRQG